MSRLVEVYDELQHPLYNSSKIDTYEFNHILQIEICI
jgi:hypothetical protein